MNIFILDLNITKCAQYHVDKHVVKMITESAQLLSTAVRSTGIDAGYKSTHFNHPCAKWVRESIDNYFWLWDLMCELHKEWQYRYDHKPEKFHGAYTKVHMLPRPDLPDIGLTPFALAMPDEYKTDDAVASYRSYYMNEKKHLASWKKRGQPDWWKEL